MIEILAPDFDLEKTLNSGQVFHWQKAGDGFVGTISDRAVFLEQRGKLLRGRVATASSRLISDDGQDAHGTIKHYFALDHPLAEICNSFPDDRVMNAARDFCRGLRIIRQPKWECLATFICSSMKQVAHIRQISLCLRERFGERRKIGDRFVHCFPFAHLLAQASEKDLRNCKLGYRAKNVRATAQLVSSGHANLEAWSELSNAELRKQLCALPGVGPKVANCVMLFAYERLRAFPIDVWIERVLRQHYFSPRKKMTAQRLREFTETYFGENGGYAQQYLFHHARMAARQRNGKRRSTGALQNASVN